MHSCTSHLLPHSCTVTWSCMTLLLALLLISWPATLILACTSLLSLHSCTLTWSCSSSFFIFISSGSDSTTFMCRIVVHVGLCPQAAHWITMSCVVLSTSVLQLLVTNIWLNLSNTPLDCILRTQESKKTAPSLEVYSGELLSEVQPYYTRTE